MIGITCFGAAALIAVAAGSVIAGQRPGAFGSDRATGVQNFQNGGVNNTGAPGASECCKIAGERAGTNGAINRDYKATHGGAPTKGAPPAKDEPACLRAGRAVDQTANVTA